MMDFPKDKKVLEMDTEYMFGRNFLVRPVTDSLYTWQDDKQNGYQKNMNKIGKTDVYLPAGAQWIDFWTGKSLKGGQTIQREVLSTSCLSMSVLVLSYPGDRLYNIPPKRNGII